MTKSPLSILVPTLLALGSASTMAAQVPSDVLLSSEQHFVRGNGAEPNTLDPTFVNSGMPGDIIVNDMFEGFVIENRDGQIIPGQAQDWRFSNGGKTVTFTLKKGLEWSNGSPVTADDFVFAWQRAVNPTTGNNTSFVFKTANVLNAEEIIAGNKAPSELGIKALDPLTVEITLSKPTPYFMSLMSIKTFFPVPSQLVKEKGERWTRPENITTNGAYTLSEWVPNEYVKVERNPKYWDNDATVINGVTYLGLSSQNAELIRYQSGEIDMTNRVQLEYYQKLIQENPEQIKAQALLGSYVYSFNTRQAPFDNVNVRQALSMAVNREILVDKITGQGEPEAYSVTPNNIPNYQAPTSEFKQLDTNQRLKQAKQLLNEAGYDQNNPLTFKLTYNTSENHKKIALAIASMWKPLGVKVELENMEWKAYVAAKSSGDYQLARSWAFGDYPEPSALLEGFTCGHTANESGYCNPEFDKLMQQASVITQQDERFKVYQQAEALLNESAAVIPLYHYNHTRLVRNTLKGLPINNPKGNIYAKDLYFVMK
ncbi:peptide ABC transporter substrate-binding protein [Vibrio sp. D404a]|uniref:peptide ABC transporter substrate-binding protein n=1 Tax=unclassified Vibrio TaxID=2614977 RepID=UPI00255413ED|nr:MULTISPECIES: peptide ABC transporter substrate-binding protein [unclassified Vibrio]MDK9736268.1 peptide ABC transporter substrate-binding protein [Vibrio sp. D404a]MDK9795890.1 peptide ABC transporter substrate-binding protein [Vibrio sp. D449a]